MKVAIVGAGIAGLAAAHDLNNAGHEVTIFEAANYVGGLAAGFKESQWDWSVEHYYHHWFAYDRDVLGLINELGLQQKVIFKRPLTVVFYQERFYPLDSPLAALTFPGFTLMDKARFGLVTAYLRYLAPWEPLEQYTAEEWIRRYYGSRLYNIFFEPLLISKFGPYYKDVNMAWFWARFKARSPRLGTYVGGFQAFADEFVDILRQRGVSILLSSPVHQITSKPEGGLQVKTPDQMQYFDLVLVTVSPALFAHIAPSLPEEYMQSIQNLKSIGAVVLTLSLRHQLSEEGYYWFNLPKIAGFPFLALVEHTNYLSSDYFNGEHIIYCGDYLDSDHEHFRLSKEELLDRFLPSLQRINPRFTPDWVQSSWLFRTTYAQPIPPVNHSRNIPKLRTPISGLYFACMSQVYPWDRGTNFAVRIGRRAACQILEDL